MEEELLKNPHLIKEIDPKELTVQLVNLIVSKMGNDSYLADYITQKLRDFLTFESWVIIIKMYSCVVRCLPKEFQTLEMYDRVFKENIMVYEYMKDDLKTEELTLTYLNHPYSSTSVIPYKLLTDSVVEKCIQKKLRFGSKNACFLSPEHSLRIGLYQPGIYEYVNPQYLSYEHWVEYSKVGDWRKIPREYRTEETAFNSCFSYVNVSSIEKENPELMTLELAFKIVKKRPVDYTCLPKYIREKSYELALCYVENYSGGIETVFIPEEFLTTELKKKLT